MARNLIKVSSDRTQFSRRMLQGGELVGWKRCHRAKVGAHQKRYIRTARQRSCGSPFTQKQEVFGTKPDRESPRFGDRLGGFKGHFQYGLCRETSINELPKKGGFRQTLLAGERGKSLFRLQRNPRHEMSVVFHGGVIVNQTAAGRLSCKSIELAHKRSGDPSRSGGGVQQKERCCSGWLGLRLDQVRAVGFSRR